MVSHKKMSGIELTLGKGGLRFKKRASGYNRCIGKQLEGGAGPRNGGRYDKGWQAQFTRAVEGCAGKKVARVV
jgi:hypothetical protein